MSVESDSLNALSISPPRDCREADRIVLEAEIIDACKDDHLRDGVPLYKIAENLGLPRRRVHAVWRKLVAGAQAAGILSPEERDAMRSYLLGTLEEVIEKSMERIHEHAAYGAIATNAAAKLWELAGLDKAEASTAGTGLKERMAKLMEAGRRLSPLLTSKPGLASLDPADVRRAKEDVEQWEAEEIVLPVLNAEEGQEPSPL